MGLCLLEIFVILAENHFFIGGTEPKIEGQLKKKSAILKDKA